MARIGMLTPSSNTVLEPVTAAMLAGLEAGRSTGIPETTAHFSRFPVVRIALDEDALAQFDPAPILHAARLLADARVDVIAWNGTSAGWLGVERDRALCRTITEETGVMATSAVLALDRAMEALGTARIALLTPYSGDVQARIVANYAGRGILCTAERHLGLVENFAFAEVTEDRIAAMTRDAVRSAPDAQAVVALCTFGPGLTGARCTTGRAAALGAAREAERGSPFLDSAAVTVWDCLRIAGVDARPLAGWGRLFATT